MDGNTINWLEWGTLVVSIVTAVTVLVSVAWLRKDYTWLRKDVEQLRGVVNNLVKHFDMLVVYLQGERKEPLGDTLITAKDGTIRGDSPLSLTEKGLEIAERLQAEKIIEKYRKHILVPLDATRLEIQDTCLNFASLKLRMVLTEEERDIIDNEIYEQEGMYRNILGIYGILFRNAFFKERNIPVPRIPVRPKN